MQELLQLGLVSAALEYLEAEIIRKVETLFDCLYLQAPSKISEVGSIDKVTDKKEHGRSDEQVEEVEALKYLVEHKRRGACVPCMGRMLAVQQQRRSDTE